MSVTHFQGGELVQFYSTAKSAWEPAHYIGMRQNSRHAIETMHGTILTVGEGRVRRTPERETLHGIIMVYRGNDGRHKVFGVFRDEFEAAKEMESWNRIYPDGPDAIINITDKNIQFSIGEGVPAAGRTR